MTGPEPHLGDLLSALLDGELPAPLEDASREHLSACPACAAELTLVATARSGVRALPGVEPPGGFRERLLGRVDHRRQAPVPGAAASAAAAGAAAAGAVRRRRVGVAALVASAAAAVAVLGLSSPREAPARPPVGRLVEAHTGVGGGDPVSQLAPAGVPVSFRR